MYPDRYLRQYRSDEINQNRTTCYVTVSGSGAEILQIFVGGDDDLYPDKYLGQYKEKSKTEKYFLRRPNLFLRLRIRISNIVAGICVGEMIICIRIDI